MKTKPQSLKNWEFDQNASRLVLIKTTLIKVSYNLELCLEHVLVTQFNKKIIVWVNVRENSEVFNSKFSVLGIVQMENSLSGKTTEN